MEVRNFTIQEMKQLLSDFSINKDNIFIVNRKKIKLSREFMEDFHKSSYFIKSHYGIDREQIEWLDSLKNKTPNNKLPDGVISYFGVDVGIIYPSYYLGLIPFEHNLSREELSLILIK